MEKKKWSKKQIILATTITLSIIILLLVAFGGLTKNQIQLKDSNGEIELIVNEKDIETQNSNINLSGTIEIFEELQGTVYIRYNTYAEDDYNLSNSVFTGETIANDETWELNKVHVLPGNNKVIISATIGEVVEEQIIDVYYDQGEPYFEVSEENIKYDEDLKTNYVNNIITVFSNDNTTENELNSILKEMGGEIVGRLDKAYDVKFNDEYTLDEIKAICDELQQFDEILFSHPSYINNITTSSDVRHSAIAYKTWEETGDWGFEAIEVPAAYNYEKRFSNINIAVVDDGFYLKHEDLKDVFQPSTDWMETINDYKYWDEENKKEVVSSHGTHVSGIIGANSDKKGITGIVDNVNIIYTDWRPNKTADKQTWEEEARIFSSLWYSVKSGAKIINYSVGSSSSMEINYTEFLNDFNSNRASINRPQEWKDEQAKIASYYILSLLRDGYDFLIVHSSGNGAQVEVEYDKRETVAVDATNNGLWSCITKDNIISSATEQEKQDIIDRIIIVGNAKKNPDGNYQQATTSNGGERVDICAPGTDIFSTTVKDCYGLMSGTSMAAPHVTGVCGLVWSVNPSFTGAEVKEIVCNYTSITVHDNPDGKHPLENTYPMVNAKLAVEEAIRRTDNGYGTLSGTVKEKASDVMLKNVIVSVKRKTDNLTKTVKTDESGTFKIKLPVGNWEITLSSDTHIYDEYAAVIIEKDVDRVLQTPIYMTLKPSKVTGTVKSSETNKPISNVKVEVIDNESGSFDPIATVTTDENGKFTLELSKGNYSVSFNHNNYEYYGMTLNDGSFSGNGTVILEDILILPRIIELKDYIGRNIETEAKQINGMKKVDVSDGSIEYKNDFLIFGASSDNNKISFIAIDGKCNYSIHHISIGNNFDSVCRNLESDNWRNDGVVGIESGGIYSNFVKNNLRITILAENNIVTSINYFGAEQDEEDIGIDSGKCGDNVFWQLNSNGELTISGNGEMSDWSSGETPWYEHKENINTVIIKNGVTYIGKYAFAGLKKLTNITIADSVIKIGSSSFGHCESLTNLVLPNSITDIGDNAFYGCKSITNITIPNSVSNIGCWAFRECESLKSITILNPTCSIFQNSRTIDNNTTIYGYENSTAQSYAKMNVKNFIILNSNNNISNSTQTSLDYDDVLAICCEAINNNNKQIILPFVYDGFGEEWNQKNIYDVIDVFHSEIDYYSDNEFEEYAGYLPIAPEIESYKFYYINSELEELRDWIFEETNYIATDIDQGIEIGLTNDSCIEIFLVMINGKWYILYFDI